MCDYSIMALPNRLAVCGEELVTHKFEIGTMGLISSADGRKLMETATKPKTLREQIMSWLNPVLTRAVRQCASPRVRGYRCGTFRANYRRIWDCGLILKKLHSRRAALGWGFGTQFALTAAARFRCNG